MNNNWKTKAKDMLIAKIIMEKYAHQQQLNALGLFELILNPSEKRLNFQVSGWVHELLNEFNKIYGINQGETIARQVITNCMTQGHTVH